VPPGPPPSRRRNPRGQGQVLKAQLIDAAAKLLATLEQPETLTLRQVAREVGVAPASIYSHFPDLSALVQHVLRLRYLELAELMTRASRDAPDPLARLAALCSTYVRWGLEQPGHYRTLFGGRMPADLAPGSAHDPGADLLDTLVEALDAASTSPQADTGQRWSSGVLLWTSLHGLISVYNDHGNLPWPPLTAMLADLIALHSHQPAAVVAAALPAF